MEGKQDQILNSCSNTKKSMAAQKFAISVDSQDDEGPLKIQDVLVTIYK